MKLIEACCDILSQLKEVITQITDEDYAKPSVALSQSTIGQHVRHTLEFFVCLETGRRTGTVNYDRRAHDKVIETDRAVALETLARIVKDVGNSEPNKTVSVEMCYDLQREDVITIESNYYRELAYNIEHAVHHMALIKIGVREAAPGLKLPPHFGVAASSVRYQEAEQSF